MVLPLLMHEYLDQIPFLDQPPNNLIESSIELNRNADNILFHPQFIIKNINLINCILVFNNLSYNRWYNKQYPHIVCCVDSCNISNKKGKVVPVLN
jgi:hypothetical protein